jgi:hypothetical protein
VGSSPSEINIKRVGRVYTKDSFTPVVQLVEYRPARRRLLVRTQPGDYNNAGHRKINYEFLI